MAFGMHYIADIVCGTVIAWDLSLTRRALHRSCTHTSFVAYDVSLRMLGMLRCHLHAAVTASINRML